MSYFAALAARASPTSALSPSARSGSPFTALDQRLGSSRGSAALAGGAATFDPFEAASASTAPGDGPFFTPSVVAPSAHFEPAVAPSASPSQGAPLDGAFTQTSSASAFERGQGSTAAFASLERARPPSAGAVAERAELGRSLFALPTSTSAPAHEPSTAEARAQSFTGNRASAAEPAGSAAPNAAGDARATSKAQQAPTPIASDPSFPAPVRQALERVEAWMRGEAKPSAEPAPQRAQRQPGQPLGRLQPAPTGTSRAAEARMPMREAAAPAPRLSVGHIEVEVITAAPPPPAPIIWHAPPAASARGPLAAPAGRASFGLRQG